MIEIILSDQVYWLSVLLVVIAIFTRKDLAIYAAAISIAGALVWYENLHNPLTFTIFCGLNTLLALIASWYNSIHSTRLSQVVATLGCIAAILNCVQIYDITQVSSYISSTLTWALMAALILMDGRKGLLNGLYSDMRDSLLRHVHLFSGTRHNKGN